MKTIMGVSGALLCSLRQLLADERGFVRLYLSPEGDDGSGAPNEELDDGSNQDPAAPEPKGLDTNVEDPDKKRLHDEAKRHRLAKKAEAEKREAAERQAAELQAKLDRLTKALDPDADVGADADEAIKAAEKRALDREGKAKQALIRSEFTAKAIAAGLSPNRVNEAFKLADLDGVEVDLDDGTVEGVQSVAAAVLEKFPEWGVKHPSNKQPPPDVDNGAPGGNHKESIDLSNFKQGDIMKMSDEELAKLRASGFKLVIPSDVPGGDPQVLDFTEGGNEGVQRIRRLMDGENPLLGRGQGG